MMAIVKRKCPRCREGEIFKHSPLNYLEFYKMNDNCPNCGQTFHPEPGFYFGAMYVSYAFSVALVMGICLFLLAIDSFTLVMGAILISVSIILFLPFIFQYSRILYLYGFGGIRRSS
jgi:uncharacterized protein (DUF983 family)